MRRAILFEIAPVLFYFRTASAQVSNATCGPSYNWMLNRYQQTPCQVAAYLGGVCEAGSEFVVPALEPGECYPGPSPQQSNSCRCSSVLYSLLSACAACQSRQYLSWSTYHQNCSRVYSGFNGSIPAVTSILAWAYQNVTKFNGFNVAMAEALPTTAPQSTSSSPTSTQTSISPTNLSNNSAPIVASANAIGHSNGKIVWAVIGVVSFLSLAIVLAIMFKLWRRQRRPKSIAPSAAYRHRYAPIDLTSSENTLLEKDTSTAESTSGSRIPSVIDIRPASPTDSNSPISLSFSYESPELSSYSPAVESSGVFSHGGHSSTDSDETISLSHFVRLVPQRRGGRW